ncbi:MAG: hypothetical protein HFJ65_03725 [Eggerthellaceae bacterium]|nr:hypothetical protein [Eggerthellaceae bacterium]
MSISTIIILAIILVCAGFAVYRLVKRGMCDCGDHCGDGGCKKGGCSHCSCADDMVKHLSKL